MLRKTLTAVTAIILGLISTVTIGGIGILIVMTTAGIAALLIAVLFLSGGFLLGYKVYKTVLNRGLVNFITAVNASPDLDNLEPSDNSNQRVYDVPEYISAFEKHKYLFNGGTIKIWGNYTFPGFNSFNKIESVKSPKANLLQITFSNGNMLSILAPENIIEGNSYLKVINCQKAEWVWTDASTNSLVSATFVLQNNRVNVIAPGNIIVSQDHFQPGEPAIILLK